MLHIEEIKALIPHRYPFLLVDRIVELEAGKMAVGIKNVSANEEFFNGHFPQYAVMPGVLIVEALAQVCGCMVMTQEEHAGKIGLFAGIDQCKFKRPVRPGDQLRLEVEMTRMKGPVAKARGVAYVDGEVAAQAEMTFAFKQSDRS
ncbi:3-hydroxyacyl-ACP dehydratase FabZ [Shouchella lonarensis]|uniref:3-hydroxyacyl-[acyl-carrier-protein] dehydratase FabZ n=1 Tax=Shouchella lonarensis TaxID=1464122 RepID=A0A1G6GXZ0_9BACI|nr:3-hydroxyacyl-ACP dehydratase FabZ [Shouchella lonarensis]SDB86794.1 3-hydroxyacyl-[acyl-carrier-protein] dehydratase [Shouchella lonarensis]